MDFEWLLYRSRYPKFKKHPRRLVWRIPRPQLAQSTENGPIVRSYIVPTVSKRRFRHLGRLEVYPHSLHIHRIEEP